MKERDIRRLSRRDLIEILFEMKKNEEDLQARLSQAEKDLEEAQDKLADKEIRLSEAGSIAEAAIAINGVFAAAQAAADDYLRSVKTLQVDVDGILANAQAESDRILAEAQQKADALLSRAQRQHDTLLAEAEAGVQEKWQAFQTKVHEHFKSI